METDIQKPKRIAARLKYPVHVMNVGDSFFAPKKDMYCIYSCVKNYNKKRARDQWIGIRIKKEGEGIRVWRVY